MITQLEAFRCVMPPVIMELAVLCHIPLLKGRFHWPWVPQQVPALSLHENLLPQLIERSKTSEPASEWLWGRARSLIPLLSAHFLLWIPGHILFLSFAILFLF